MIEKTGGGLLVPPDDADALADGLYSLWQEPERARALGERGFHGVREHFSVQRSADKQLAVYERLVSAAAGGVRSA